MELGERRFIGSAVGAVICLVGFFLPWVGGAGALAGRNFAGFESAQLAQTVADVTSSRGVLVVTILLYLVPISALDGGLVALAGAWGIVNRRLARRAVVVFGLYPCVISIAVSGAAIWFEAETGPLRLGLGVVAVGAVMMLLPAASAPP